MLFMVNQAHPPETCPKVSGHANTHIDIDGQDIALKGCWEASTHHTLWYLVEAEDTWAVHRFIGQGRERCATTVEPVKEVPLWKPTKTKRRLYVFNPPPS